MNHEIVYIIKNSSNQKLIGKKLLLECIVEKTSCIQYILTVFEDSKDNSIMRYTFSESKLFEFLKNKHIVLELRDNASRVNFNRCLKDHTGLSMVWNVTVGLPIFGVTFDQGLNTRKHLHEYVDELNKESINHD